MSNLVSTYIRLADIRGYSKHNPLVFNIREEGNIFKIVYSEYEPRRSELPVNVLWLEHGTRTLRKRVSFEKSQGFNYSWVEIPEESVFDEPQYYDVQPDDLRDLGFGSHSIVGNATVEEEGLVRLLNYNANAVVVPDVDPRLSDPRNPTDHDHPDFPRTMVKITPDIAGILDEAKHPTSGCVLFIKEQIDGSSFSCEWRKPDFDEIEWDQPMLMSLNIELAPGAVASDNSKFPLVCSATWTDRVDSNASVEWSIADNEYGITISRSGMVSCPNLSQDTTLTVTARKQDPFFKHYVEDVYQLEIKNLFDQPIGVVIEGAASMYEETTEHYSYFLLYESGARKLVTPKTSTSSIGDIASGIFMPGQVSDDSTAILSVAVRENGFSFVAEKEVLVIKNSVVKLEFMYQGQTVSELDADEGSLLVLPSYRATFKNDSTLVYGYADLNGLGVSSDADLEDFDNSSVKFGNVHRESNVTLDNSLTLRGDTVSATLVVTIKDIYPFVEELLITGDETVGPNILLLSPEYKRSGVQSLPQADFNLTAVVDGKESNLSSAFEGMEYEVTWALVDPSTFVNLRVDSYNDAHLVVQMDERNSANLTEVIPLTVTAKVYIKELDLTFNVSKDFEVIPLNMDELVGPVFVANQGGSVTTEISVNANSDGDAGFNVNNWSILLLTPEQAQFPLSSVPVGVLSFVGGPSNYDSYKNYTYLQFSCEDHEVEVFTSKVGYNWRTSVWVRGVVSGETFNLTVTDPRIDKSFTQQFTVN